MSSFAELAFSLKALEKIIIVHAKINQFKIVEDLLKVSTSKAKLQNSICLLPEWNDDLIQKQKIHIIICGQYELENFEKVEKCFKALNVLQFNHLIFLKYAEYPDIKENPLENLSMKIDDLITVNIEDLKFHVARYGSDESGRSIKIIVYVDPKIEHTLKQSKDETHWKPDQALIQMLDMIFGEYYMTKYISTINFVPAIVMPKNCNPVSAREAKEYIDVLLGLDIKYCQTCNFPSYRILIKDESKSCISCNNDRQKTEE